MRIDDGDARSVCNREPGILLALNEHYCYYDSSSYVSIYYIIKYKCSNLGPLRIQLPFTVYSQICMLMVT